MKMLYGVAGTPADVSGVSQVYSWLVQQNFQPGGNQYRMDIPQSLNTHTAYLEHISIGAVQVKHCGGVTPYTIGSQSIDHDD